ncbi:MAG TPA: FmdB family zinc ribbon protein [Acidimicrobiia bacterium]|jgi:putative FmdB family regulatory protein|nr:FmdB family zinc ribbon protein [Acidimicrobiia bacterium]
MPTYQYRCAKCGEDLEVFQSFSDKPLTRHAKCGGKLQKVLSSVGIVLKGSGFYKTDNRSSSSKPKRDEPASASSESKSSTESGSSDTKTSASSSSDSAKSSNGSSNGSKSKSDKKPAAKSA